MKKFVNFLKEHGLPVLARAVSGNPLSAVGYLAQVIGGSPTEEDLMERLQADPELFFKLKEYEELHAKRIEVTRENARNFTLGLVSNSTSWLQRNVSALIALVWIVFCLALYYTALTQPGEIDGTVVSSITNITMLIVGFYFGSSER